MGGTLSIIQYESCGTISGEKIPKCENFKPITIRPDKKVNLRGSLVLFHRLADVNTC